MRILPKNLPDAFNRALEKISDDRYGRTTFELVAAAKRPLTTEELRIALNIEPGQPVWNSTTLAYDCNRLVSLCGGGLLEVEEETGTVQFIHFSARQHLSSEPEPGASTMKFHFTSQEADMSMGSRCVTYLCYPDFETQVSTGRPLMLNAGQVSSVVQGSLKSERRKSKQLMTLALRSFKLGQASDQQDVSINLSSALEHYLHRHQTQDHSAFLPFAREYWLDHTRHLCRDMDSPSFSLFHRLVTVATTHITKPWQGPLEVEGLRWALSTSNGSLLEVLLGAEYNHSLVVQGVVAFIHSNPLSFNIDGSVLGRLLLYFVDHGDHGEKVFGFLVAQGARLPPAVDCLPLTTTINAMHRTDKRNIGIIELLLRAGAEPGRELLPQ